MSQVISWGLYFLVCLLLFCCVLYFLTCNSFYYSGFMQSTKWATCHLCKWRIRKQIGGITAYVSAFEMLWWELNRPAWYLVPCWGSSRHWSSVGSRGQLFPELFCFSYSAYLTWFISQYTGLAVVWLTVALFGSYFGVLSYRLATVAIVTGAFR